MYAVFTVGIANEVLPDILKPIEKIDRLLAAVQKKYYEARFKKIRIQTSLREWLILIIVSGCIFWVAWNYLNDFLINIF